MKAGTAIHRQDRVIIGMTVALFATMGIAYGLVYGWRPVSVVIGIGVGFGLISGLVALLLKRGRRP